MSPVTRKAETVVCQCPTSFPKQPVLLSETEHDPTQQSAPPLWAKLGTTGTKGNPSESEFALNITQSNTAELQRAEGQIFLNVSEHLKMKKGH